MTYQDKLKDPRWQKLRLQRLNKAKWKCEECGDAANELHVHHNWYGKSGNPWDVDSPDDQLQVLCQTCHSARHKALAWLSVIESELSQEMWDPVGDAYLYLSVLLQLAFTLDKFGFYIGITDQQPHEAVERVMDRLKKKCSLLNVPGFIDAKWKTFNAKYDMPQNYERKVEYEALSLTINQLVHKLKDEIRDLCRMM